jgi:glycogen synthase
LLRLGVDLTLVIGQPPGVLDNQTAAERIVSAARLPMSPRFRVHQIQYDLLSPLLRPNSILGRQVNYPIFSLREGVFARGLIRRGAIDVVHAQGLCAWGFGLVRRFDTSARQTPFVANPHGMEEYRTPSRLKRLAYTPFRALYSAGNRAADRAIATDACTSGDLPHYLGVDTDRVVVIPSAIDVDEALEAADSETGELLRERLGLVGCDPVLLSVGRLERNKGFHVLAAALASSRAVLGTRWRWVLVGSGKEEAKLRRQVEALGISGHVVFAGTLNDRELHSLYEVVTLFVHPTLYEGSSLTTLEAMVHGRPVIASATGGIPDKVFPGRNGLLVPPGDVASLGNALETALLCRDEWPSWGKQGRQIVETTFAWPIVARRTLQEYQRLMGLRPKA